MRLNSKLLKKYEATHIDMPDGVDDIFSAHDNASFQAAVESSFTGAEARPAAKVRFTKGPEIGAELKSELKSEPAMADSTLADRDQKKESEPELAAVTPSGRKIRPAVAAELSDENVQSWLRLASAHEGEDELPAAADLEVGVSEERAFSASKQNNSVRFGFDFGPKQFLAAALMFGLMFLGPVYVYEQWRDSSNYAVAGAYTTNTTVQSGRVAGVNTNTPVNNANANANANSTPGVQANNAPASVVASSQTRILGLPLGTAFIVGGMLLLLIPIAVLLRM